MGRTVVLGRKPVRFGPLWSLEKIWTSSSPSSSSSLSSPSDRRGDGSPGLAMAVESDVVIGAVSEVTFCPFEGIFSPWVRVPLIVVPNSMTFQNLMRLC